MLGLLDNYWGAFFFSFILGLGLAALFRRVCNDGNCVIVQGPPRDEVENKIFKKDSKCYRYISKDTDC
jgi:hypothetical protein